MTIPCGGCSIFHPRGYESIGTHVVKTETWCSANYSLCLLTALPAKPCPEGALACCRMVFRLRRRIPSRRPGTWADKGFSPQLYAVFTASFLGWSIFAYTKFYGEPKRLSPPLTLCVLTAYLLIKGRLRRPS